jgi:hypothetical protein
MAILASNRLAIANSGTDPFTNPQPYAIASIEARGRAYSTSSPGGSRAVRRMFHAEFITMK